MNIADRAKNGGGGNRTHDTFPTVRTPSPKSRDFSARVEIAGFKIEVKRDGKHTNLHLLSAYEEPGVWNFEPLETALPKLKALVAAAELA